MRIMGRSPDDVAIINIWQEKSSFMTAGLYAAKPLFKYSMSSSSVCFFSSRSFSSVSSLFSFFPSSFSESSSFSETSLSSSVLC